jgi:hypothetical protein
MTDKEVMQLALDNLIDVRDEDGIDCVEAILKLRAALAQPEREWQGLTEADMDELIPRFARYELIRAAEAKLKEKNT